MKFIYRKNFRKIANILNWLTRARVGKGNVADFEGGLNDLKWGNNVKILSKLK